jgi:threonyl-tRNA synthetase
VVGDKELQAGTVAVRARGNVDLGVMPLATFAERLRLEVEQRSNGHSDGGGLATRGG